MNHRLLSIAVLPAAITFAGTTPPGEPAGPPGSGFAAMLEQVPAAFLEMADFPILYYVDMTLVWERVGVGVDPQERLDNLGRTTMVETFSQFPQMFGPSARQVDQARAEVGFSAVEIDREIAVLAPPSQLIIAETTVPPSFVDAALHLDPVWSPDLREVEGPAAPYYAWGDDGMDQDLTRRSAFRPLGQPGQVAVLGSEAATVIRTLDDDHMTLAQRAITGDEPSLAEAGPFVTIVDALDGAVVIQAIGVVQPTHGPLAPDPSGDDPSAIARLEPYTGLLLTEVISGDTTSTQILLAHASPEEAATNGKRATDFLTRAIDPVSERPVAELLPGATVAVEDTVMIVTVPGPGSYRAPMQMLFSNGLFPAE